MGQLSKQQIADMLNNKGANRHCARCGRAEFSILDGVNMIQLQDSTEGLSFGGNSVPSVLVACVNCGAITFHALGALGLLPPTEEE